MKRKSVFFLVACMIPIFLFSATVLAAEHEKAAAPKPKPEPKYLSMKFKMLGGSGETTLKPLLKKNNTLLVFFQSACISCKTELEVLKADFTDHPKADVVGIGVDVRPAQLESFVANLGFPKTVLLDPQFTLGPKVKVTYTPAVVILDKDGHLVSVIGGYTTGTLDRIKASLK
jgi:peroxiredoxin